MFVCRLLRKHNQDEATVRSLRDNFVELWNMSVKWRELNKSGCQLIESIVNERLRLIDPSATSTSEVDFNIEASRSKVHRHADQVVELLGEMERIPVKFKTVGERLNALVKLCKKDGARYKQATQAIDITRQLTDMFSKELEAKRATLRDLAETTDDRDLLMTVVVTWTHEPFLAPELFNSLLALTA